MNPLIIASLIRSTVHNITALELSLTLTSSFLFLPLKSVLLNWTVKALLPSSCTDPNLYNSSGMQRSQKFGFYSGFYDLLRSTRT